MYLFLSPNDSSQVFPDNTNTEYITELNKPLSGNLIVALAEFQCINLPDSCYVFCDIISPSLVKNQDLPLLRIVNKKGEPSHLHYFKVSHPNVQRIKITITDTKLQPPKSIDNVTCILHFKTI